LFDKDDNKVYESRWKAGITNCSKKEIDLKEGERILGVKMSLTSGIDARDV
jgi:hypothetical protein